MSTALANLQVLLAQCRAGAIPASDSHLHAVRMRTARARATLSSAPVPTPPFRFVDIGVNLLDSMFEGNYRGKQHHPLDLDAVLARAAEAGVSHAIVTAGSLEESRRALSFVRAQRAAGCPVRLHSTVGVHPTRSLEFLPDADRAEVEAAMAAVPAEQRASACAEAVALASLETVVLSRLHVKAAMAAHVTALRSVLDDGVTDGAVVAVGECGLDYDRLAFCPKGVQRASYAQQLELAHATLLPLFLHNRATGGEFAAMCAAERSQMGAGGVVHSFDGDVTELEELLGLGLHIGLNGCSLKTRANLDVAARVPLDRLHLETDAPWCGIKGTHAGAAHVRPLLAAATGAPHAEEKKEKWRPGALVKDRCEPCHIRQVLQVVSAARGGRGEAAEAEVAAAAFENSMRMFQLE